MLQVASGQSSAGGSDDVDMDAVNEILDPKEAQSGSIVRGGDLLQAQMLSLLSLVRTSAAPRHLHTIK